MRKTKGEASPRKDPGKGARRVVRWGHREARLLLSLTVLVVLAVGTWSGTARAQANYEGIQVGGRTALMGGTAVANGSDQAAVFINPAATTRIPETSFAFSTFMAQIRGRTIRSSLDPSKRLNLSSPDINQLKLRIQPNTFCVFLNGPPKDAFSGRSRHKYSFCAAATEREELEFTKNKQDSNAAQTNVRGVAHSTNLKFVRSTVAFSWGYELTRDTSIGVTARMDNARLNDQTTATAFQVQQSSARLTTLDHSIEAFSWDTALVIGITHDFSRVVTLGASLTTPSQHLFGRYSAVAALSATQGLSSALTQDDGDFLYHHPGSLRLGFAFTWPRLILGIDASFFGPQRQLARANFDRRVTVVDPVTNTGTSVGGMNELVRGNVSERGKPVTNLAVGAEYFLRRDYSLVTGLQTDFSGLHPRVDTAATEVLFRQHKDTVHAAVGITTYGDSSRLLLGVRGHYSRGTLLIADPSLSAPGFVVLPQTEWGLNLIVSGSLTFGAVKAAAARAIPLNQATTPNRRSRNRGTTSVDGIESEEEDDDFEPLADDEEFEPPDDAEGSAGPTEGDTAPDAADDEGGAP